MTTQDLIDYYKALLILQYASLGNALGTMDAFLNSLIQNQIISQLRDGLDVTTAMGAQLNILGTYRGINRETFGLIPADYWALVPYTDPDPGSYFGWPAYADANPTWNWLAYNDLNGLPYSLTDTQMSRLIQFAAALDSCDMTLGSLDTIMFNTFGTYVNIVDNKDMTMIYQHSLTDPDPDTLFDIAVLENVLPHPSGVGFTIVEV